MPAVRFLATVFISVPMEQYLPTLAFTVGTVRFGQGFAEVVEAGNAIKRAYNATTLLSGKVLCI